MREETIMEVLRVEFSRPAEPSSPQIQLMLLMRFAPETGIRVWHVACRRGFLTADGDRDYGGEDTYVEELSRTGFQTELDARVQFKDNLITIANSPAWSRL